MGDFKVMLAAQTMPDLSAINYPIYVQPKLDGFRAIYIPDQGFISRSGKKFRNLKLETYFDCLNSVKGVILDGELYIPGQEFQHLTSTVNKEDGEIVGLKYIIYDAIFEQDWELKQTKVPYSDRLRLVRTLVTSQIADFNKVLDIPTDLIDNFKEAKVLYKYYLEQGNEGIIIRKPQGSYKWGRSTLREAELLKVKPFQSIDIPIVGFNEGENQFEGSLGSLICDLGDSRTVFVGTGISVALREEIWQNKELYLGKIVEVKFMDYTEDNKSLRQPIFMRFRDDK